MSRRPNPAADRAAQNQQTLKSLVKLESNKSCADCKKNKHPRWASWNLGIFICIRCSGIHRGMGTHISRVKSVDLDSWTDEQLQSMLRWGNARANIYWEAKLAPGHVPAEAKIENFIRTKYDSKRWCMDGPMPDPATLNVNGDDDVPLNVVQEKAKLDRSASQRNGTSSAGIAPPPRSNNNIDLFGDAPARPSTAEPAITSRPPPVKAPAVPPKQTRPGDSLLGLDFLGGTQSAPPARPSSATSGMSSGGVPQRTDLKQSILSLYASAPRTAAPPPQPSSNSLAGLSSPPLQSPTQTSSDQFGGMTDAFSTLNFAPSPAQQQPASKPAAFSSLSSPAATRQPSITSPTFSSGGGFFDSKLAPAAKSSPPPPTKSHMQSMSSGFGDFGDFTSATPTASTARSPPPPTSTMGDLFDLSGPAPAPRATPVVRAPPSVSVPAPTPSYSAFNLSTPAPSAAPKQTPAPAPTNFSSLSNADAWGSNDAWSTPDPEPAPAPAPKAAPQPAKTATYKAPPTTAVQSDFGGWDSNDASTSSQPTVTQDDDFGGWSSASPVATPAAQPVSKPTSKPFGGGDDLFGNVWE